MPASRPPHAGSTPTFRKRVIDLSVTWQLAPYDKTGGIILINNLKGVLFKNRNIRLTKERCEDFFDNDDNFVNNQ